LADLCFEARRGSRRLTARWRFSCFIAVLALFFCVTKAFAETRVALVIGNGQYRAAPTLRNPPEDAKDVAAELQSLGFKVTLGVDLDLAGMNKAIADFVKTAANSDVSLIYYGGHGLQVDLHNYIVPVDARLHDEQDIRKQTISLDDMLKALAQTKGVHIVFLDACRTNPLKNARSQGLAKIGDSADVQGFLIAFATSPDKVAYDGAGRNSPFAQALLAHMATRGENISTMMIDVHKDIFATTGGAQTPWDTSSLTQQFYFEPGEAAQISPETMLWQLGAGQKDPVLLKEYLDRYPEGAHVSDARALVAEIEATNTPSPPPAKESHNEEELLWSVAQTERQALLYQDYVTRYPNGSHRQEADELIARLQETKDAEAAPEFVCQRLATHQDDGTAQFPGVKLQTLAENADQAIKACGDAVAKHPDQAHYVALLARATAASGRVKEAVELYEKAAAAGDVRAIHSLGRLYEDGDGLPKDLKKANEFYAKAAERGLPDAQLDLGFALMNGVGIDRDAPRGIALLKSASAAGLGRATFNLGVLAMQGVAGRPSDALDFFHRAVGQGEPRGHRAAAVLFNGGVGVAKNPAAAADELLRAVESDDETANKLASSTPQPWSSDTIKAMQARLKTANYYSGPLDGKTGPALAPALKQWRTYGAPSKVANANTP
jgi:tetratricopeptide (TPR) repeat protein